MMKSTSLFACGLLVILSQTILLAQTNTTNPPNKHQRDTLMVLFTDGNKLLITGQPIKTLLAYTAADSIKKLFVTDYEKATSSNTLPNDASLIHYFVHPSGKRRLIAEIGECAHTKVDIVYETKRLDLDLPKYLIYIHDLTAAIDMQLFIQNPIQAKVLLSGINLSDAIKAASKEKRSFRTVVKTEITLDNKQFTIADVKSELLKSIEVTPVIGIGVIGNTIIPVLGADFYYCSKNKYKVSSYKIGYGMSAFPMTITVGGDIITASLVSTREFRFIKNLNMKSVQKEYWLGIQAGLFTSEELTSFKNAYKVGIMLQNEGPFEYSFDYIKTGDNKTLFGFTAKMNL